MNCKFRARVKSLECSRNKTATFYYQDSVTLPNKDKKETRGIAWTLDKNGNHSLLALSEKEIFSFNGAEDIFSFINNHSSDELIIEISQNNINPVKDNYALKNECNNDTITSTYTIVGVALNYE